RESHFVKRDLAAHRRRQRGRMRRPRNRGLDGEDFEQPLGRAGSLRHFTAEFRQRAERACRERSEENELQKPTSRDLRRKQLLRTDPENNYNASEGEEDSEPGQQRASA